MYMHGSRWGGEGGRADNFPQKNSNFIFHSSCKNNHKNASDPTPPPSPTQHNLTLNFKFHELPNPRTLSWGRCSVFKIVGKFHI